MIAAIAHQPTETEIYAVARRENFQRKIAKRAAALNAKAIPADVIPLRVEPREPEFPAQEPIKAPWFQVEAIKLVRAPRIREIQLAVCNACNIDVTALTSQRRTAPLVRARQVACYLAKELTGKSLPEIGRRFGGRDHTTILHAVRKIGAMVVFNADAPEMFDADLSEFVASLRADIEAGNNE